MRFLIAAVAATVVFVGADIQAQAHHVDEHIHPPRAGSAAADSPVPTAVIEDGLRIPDARLVDQDGKAVRFYSDLVAGKTVAMHFVFTTCTTICRPLGAIFGRLRQLLDETGRDVDLISVTVDPATDTPQRLKAWRSRFGTGPGWTLVTGAKPEIDSLLKALGAFTPDYEDHSPLLLVGNEPAGHWIRASGLASPAEIASLIDGLGSAGRSDGEVLDP